MSSGTITLRRPRVRGVEERFESRVLPFVRTTDEGAGPHLLKDVFEARKFEDGKPVSTQQRKNAA